MLFDFGVQGCLVDNCPIVSEPLKSNLIICYLCLVTFFQDLTFISFSLISIESNGHIK